MMKQERKTASIHLIRMYFLCTCTLGIDFRDDTIVGLQLLLGWQYWKQAKVFSAQGNNLERIVTAGCECEGCQGTNL